MIKTQRQASCILSNESFHDERQNKERNETFLNFQNLRTKRIEFYELKNLQCENTCSADAQTSKKRTENEQKI